MLERWIVDGVLEDPHSEFCICEDQVGGGEDQHHAE
jgi:hypothetical protein